MRLRLLASVCLSAILVPDAPVRAETVVGTRRTDPISTATINAGARDDIRISSAGSVVPTGGVAVTIATDNRLTNEGLIQITDADGATGVLAAAGTSGGIVNSGRIVIDETYAPTDTDKDGDLDGRFAAGTGRTAIRTAGAFSGAIAHSGTITVEGNDSAGIWLSGPLTGSLTHGGTTSITGDRTVGVRMTDVTGNVRLAGAIAAIGENAVGARLDGDITGALVVQGAIGVTGYRTSSPPASTTALDADDLLQSGSALVIAGSVSGGIILAVPPRDSSPTDNDEDKDGIPDAQEGSATVTVFGAAPAMQIGAADRAVAIGAVAGNTPGFGLVIDGGISGSGSYSGIDGTALAIGGLGGAVTIAGGIGVNGQIEATSNGASATAIRIGSGAATPEIRVAGTVTASGGGTTASRSTAVAIESGASVTTIRNSGTIRAAASGADGSATAIVDRSGGVTLVENSGRISASGALATSDHNVAIDLSASTGATVRQTAVAATATAPSIVGDIRFGAGNDILDVADGTVRSSTRFGEGANRLSLSGDATYDGGATFGAGNDSLTLSGTSIFTGAADFGGGADTLTLADTSRFTGTLANARSLAVAVAGGTLEVERAASIASLAVGAGGRLGVTLDRTGTTGTMIDVAGQASFQQGSQLLVRLASVVDAEGRYLFLRAGSITGADRLTASTALLPVFFKGTVTAVGATDLAVDIVRKTAGKLGLNRSQASAYDAVYRALGGDQKVAAAFLGLTDGEAFRRSVRQMLPDHAGGTFEVVTQGSRASARMLADPKAPFKDEGRWGYWINQIALGTSKSVDDTAGYSVSGWGISAGAEYKTGLGNFGGSIGYVAGQDDDRGTNNEVKSDQWELAGYWRGDWGGLRANARVSAARIDFDGGRSFQGSAGTENVTRRTRGSWNGDMVSASGGLSYEVAVGNLSFRPVAAIDYYRLKEDGYGETGGGRSFDLIVGSRTSDELAATGSVAAGLNFGGADQDSGWMRVELEGGRREIVAGKLGSTTARFDGGQAFVLVPEDRTSGWIGKLRATGGNTGFRVGGELNAEQQQDRAVLSLRASVQIGL
jgi:hypothetical protein